MTTNPSPLDQFLAELEQQLTSRDRDLSQLSAEEQFQLLKRRAVHIVKEDLLLERLKESKTSGRPLRVKYGIDPTSPDAHLGHAVPILIARRLQQMGHHIIMLFGDFTAFVGDPTGRVQERPVLSQEEIRHNASLYSQQIGKVVDIQRAEIVYNSKFYEGMTILDLFRLYRANKLQPLLQRDDFRQRAEGLTIAEALYPTLMAIDSIKLDPDVELGGNDQLLNFQNTVAFMESVGMKPQSAITTDLLQGISGDGSKMSKSLGNAISLNESAEQAYGRTMKIPDSLLEHWYKLLTDITDEQWTRLSGAMSSSQLNPKVVKELLARIIVSMLHSREDALREQSNFERVHAQHQLPEEMPEFTVSGQDEIANVTDLAIHCGFAKSRSEVRRLVQSSAVRFIMDADSETIADPFAPLPDCSEFVLNVGKRRFARVTITSSKKD